MLSVKQAAKQLGISDSLVYALCSAGVIKHRRHGRPGKRGCIRIDEDAVEKYRKASERTGEESQVPLVLKHIQL